jgi:aspartyl-tRNA(Asn)/glutamyl-tRNA(Gln) amidotransferase subunit A
MVGLIVHIPGCHVRPPLGGDVMKTSKNYALSRTKGFGEEVRRRILLGTYALTAEYVSFPYLLSLI